jgi:hypothetical protein
MATVQYESKDDSGHRFWTARHGRYAIRIDANRPGLYRWVITLESAYPPIFAGCGMSDRIVSKRVVPPPGAALSLTRRQLAPRRRRRLIRICSACWPVQVKGTRHPGAVNH